MFKVKCTSSFLVLGSRPWEIENLKIGTRGRRGREDEYVDTGIYYRSGPAWSLEIMIIFHASTD